MTSVELRKRFLEFFEKNGHKIVPSSSLIPTDPSVLFTTAGMQQFKPYYLGEKSPFGPNVATCQKCFRTSDINETGDESHLTFFEMLGNFSFGGYGKKEAIKLAKEFLDSINIKIDYVSVFGGEGEVSADEESEKIWKTIDPDIVVKKFGRADNFWGPTGLEGPCGPTTEIYSGGIEIWNIVFNQYYCRKDKSLTKLDNFGVDTGMGLERLTMVVQEKNSVYETDLFLPVLKNLQVSKNSTRIVADHIKAAVFLIAEGILPSNVERGYVLRRILRRAIRQEHVLNLVKHGLIPLAQKIIEVYQDVYPEVKTKENDILTAVQNEEEKFEKTLEQGLKQFEKRVDAFELYATYGFPIELTTELAKEKGIKIDTAEFERKFKEHQDISRAGAEKKFGGHGLNTIEATNYKLQAIKLHTATHLLHAALRQVLGSHVQQMGSDINSERTRFDFSHPSKMRPEEIKKVENLINQKIREDLEVKKEEMKFEEAVRSGALAFFKEKYPEIVNVYAIKGFSEEVCAGPHVKKTGELGKFKIIKEESSSSGIRRIRGVLMEK